MNGAKQAQNQTKAQPNFKTAESSVNTRATKRLLKINERKTRRIFAVLAISSQVVASSRNKVA